MYPVIRLFDLKRIDYKFIHIGQHYDPELFLEFLKAFKIREPDYSIELTAPSGSPINLEDDGYMHTKGDHAMPESVPRRSNAGHVGESVVGLSPLAQRHA